MNPELMEIDTAYTRVLPRDLFNEAKLLKCLGLLCLLIHDGLTPVPMSVNDELGPQDGFCIGLMEDGYLAVANLDIFIRGERHSFRTQYNSKENYPLYVTFDYVDYLVFDEQGKWDQEFINFCNTL